MGFAMQSVRPGPCVLGNSGDPLLASLYALRDVRHTWALVIVLLPDALARALVGSGRP
jgi:hypothetical protein